MSLLLLFGGAGGPVTFPGSPAAVDVEVETVASTFAISVTFDLSGAPADVEVETAAATVLWVLGGDPVDVEVAVVAAGFGLATTPDPITGAGYVVKVVDNTGAVLATLTNASVDQITWELNAEGGASFVSPKADPLTAEVSLLGREIQIYRDDDLLHWGVPVRASSAGSQGPVRFDTKGLWWYFRRRFFGSANRTNMIANPSFEDDLAGWNVSDASLTATAVTGPPTPVLGSKTARLVTAAKGQNNYLSRQWSYRTNFPPGQYVTLTGWVWIDNAGWVGPAYEGRGLMLVRRVGGEIVRWTFAPIDDATPRGRWVRLETAFTVTPFEDGTLEARLYSPGGTVRWDATQAVLMESTSANWPDGNDQAELARRIVSYAQTGRGKSDLNIGTNTPETGVSFFRAWQHAEHAEIAETIEDEFVQVDDGFDISIEVTPKTRTFTTHYPRKGSDKSGTLTLATSTNVADYRYDLDALATATSVIVLGDGDGPDREEGEAVDTSILDGLVLEDVLNAPSGTEVTRLAPIADEELATRKRVLEVLEVVAHEGNSDDLIHGLEVGDIVRATIDDGFVQVDAKYRVVRKTLNARSDTVTLTLNWWSALS